MSKVYVMVSGEPSSGKSTIARVIKEALHDKGIEVGTFADGKPILVAHPSEIDDRVNTLVKDGLTIDLIVMQMTKQAPPVNKSPNQPFKGTE